MVKIIIKKTFVATIRTYLASSALLTYLKEKLVKCDFLVINMIWNLTKYVSKIKYCTDNNKSHYICYIFRKMSQEIPNMHFSSFFSRSLLLLKSFTCRN